MREDAASRTAAHGPALRAAESAAAPVAASKAAATLLLWPETPPGAREGDDIQARAIAKAITDGRYEIPGGKRRGVTLPTVDVYLPGEAESTGTGVIVCCGGGYDSVCIESEGLPMAQWLNANGIAAFIVSYRCRPYKHPVPFWDVQRAIRLVRSRAEEFGVRSERIGTVGFSAGGHITSMLSVHHTETFRRELIDAIDKISARPTFSCLVYPLISMRDGIAHAGCKQNLLGRKPSDELVARLSSDEHVDKDTPPAFLAHSKVDTTMKFTNSTRYHEACRANGVPSEYILMETGEHGTGLRDGKPAIRNAEEDYADAFLNWIERWIEMTPED